jgi:5-methylcytosine-specific restriction endonuclease McrA
MKIDPFREVVMRKHATIGAMIKAEINLSDARGEHPPWNEEDEELKNEIFGEIVVSGKCYYCGRSNITENDHFVPTNGRRFDSPCFGLENEGNKIPSCKQCNQHKSNKHPIEWLTKGRTKTKNTKPFKFPRKTIETFEKFWDCFEHKLIANKETTNYLMEYVIPEVEKTFAEWSDVEVVTKKREEFFKNKP